MIVTVSLDALHGGGGAPCELEDTGMITPETARRIACDATVTRVISPAIRTALNLRDRGCVIGGCLARARYCDAHHLQHWADGGPTRLTNLALLCTRHHTLVHQGKIRLPMRQ